MTDPDPGASEGASVLRQTLAEAAAFTRPDRESSGGGDVEFVYFKIHDQLYAIPSTQVSAILGAQTLTELPHAPAHLCGVLSHQGRIVAVVDVAILEGREAVGAAKRILIVDGAGLDAGLCVSDVLEIAHVDAALVEPVPDSLSPPDHVVGQLRRAAGVCFVMDAARLLERVRQRMQSARGRR